MDFLCIVAGIVEEMAFRGCLHRQFSARVQGAEASGMVFSAPLFGAAHGYQGARNVVLLTVFGALFSGLVLLRRNLRGGMVAHIRHDLFAELTLAWLKAHRVS